jgi:hypothetical protein
MTAAPPFPSVIRSNGNAKLQPAAMKKMEADVKTGRDGETDSKNPAEMGAITPVLQEISSLFQSSSDSLEVTHSRLRAADVPHAVPRMAVPNVSGVIPSTPMSSFPCARSLDGRLTKNSVHRRCGGTDQHRADDHC